MLLLALLAYATTYGLDSSEGITFVIEEAGAIARQTFPQLGILFLIVTGTMLAATQLTVLDSTSRIITENILLLKSGKDAAVSKAYYIVLWSQIIFGICVFMFGFDEPRALITLGAVINAFAMFVYIGLILWLNQKLLAKELRPSWWRVGALGGALLFFGFFSILTIYQRFFA